jgi:hypothetical protein
MLLKINFYVKYSHEAIFNIDFRLLLELELKPRNDPKIEI